MLSQTFSLLSSRREMDATSPSQRRDFPAVFVILSFPPTCQLQEPALRPVRDPLTEADSVEDSLRPCPFS